MVALVSGMGWHVQDLGRAAARLGILFEPRPFQSLSASVGEPGRFVHAEGEALRDVEGVLVRMMPPGTLEQVVFRMNLLNRLEAVGVPVVNPPRAVEISVDKYLTLALLEARELSVPASFATETADAALEAYDRLGPDVVIKPLFGSEGRGLMRIHDRELARRTFQTLERLGALIYVQRLIRHPGFDYRAFVLDGRILGTMRRHAPSGDWRTNVAVGGRPEACTLSPEHTRLALAAAAATGAVIAGVDLLDDLDRDQPVVLEVNGVPGWRALAHATGCDVATAILEALGSRMR